MSQLDPFRPGAATTLTAVTTTSQVNGIGLAGCDTARFYNQGAQPVYLAFGLTTLATTAAIVGSSGGGNNAFPIPSSGVQVVRYSPGFGYAAISSAAGSVLYCTPGVGGF